MGDQAGGGEIFCTVEKKKIPAEWTREEGTFLTGNKESKERGSALPRVITTLNLLKGRRRRSGRV